MGEAVSLGVDIGGTKISALVVDGKNRILGRARKKSRPDRGSDAVLKRAVEVALEACEQAAVGLGDIDVVGVGAPSPVLPDGTAVLAPNMGWVDFPLTKKLGNLLDRPVFAENDCNVGTYGEFAVGGRDKAATLVGLFMGTGLGGGLVKGGRLITGDNHMAAEVGHMTIQVGGRLCGCGKRGCAEAYSSKKGMGYAFRQGILLEKRDSVLREILADGNYDNVKSSVLKKAWDEKDALVREILTEAAEYLGVTVGNLVTLLGPEVVVLGGGVFAALGEELLPIVKEHAKRHAFPQRSIKDTKIELATLGDDAVALGAVAYARTRAQA